MRTRVKICGLTREEDALLAVGSGADAIGLVFYPPSPRAVSIERARDIVGRLPPFVSIVALFVDEEVSRIQRVLDSVPVDLLQFHGRETPAQCAVFAKPFIKAVRMRDGVDMEQVAAKYPRAAGLLLDSYQPGQPGGTGTSFDWSRIPPALAGRIVLAGGLTPDNVERAVRQVRPYAVDVSGGVEREKGVKDRNKIRAFMRGVRCGDDT